MKRFLTLLLAAGILRAAPAWVQDVPLEAPAPEVLPPAEAPADDRDRRGPEAVPKKPVSRGWRGQGRPSEAAKGLPKREPSAPATADERPKFSPGKASDRPQAEAAETPSARTTAGVEEQQWRRSPPDRRWESWREFPAEKQIDLWRKLEPEERGGYWRAMNVHERFTLWLRMTTEEKETYWERLPESERAELCALFPPKEKALWEPRLAAKPEAADASGKFRPAKPAPGFQPKSSYREDDEE
jgi:hypothetical protein